MTIPTTAAVVALLLACVAVPAIAQNDLKQREATDESSRSKAASATSDPVLVVIIPSWTAGDSMRYEQHKWREEDRDGERVRSGGVIAPLTVTVQSQSDSGCRVSWTLGPGRLEDGAPALRDDAPESIAALGRGIGIVMDLDEDYTPVAVVNFEEIRAKLLALLDDLFAASTTKAGDRAASVVREQFSRRESLEPILMKEATAFFATAGLVAAVGDTHTTETVLGNPLGGEPFPVIVTTIVTSLDTNGIATVETSLKFEPNAATRIMTEYLSRLAGKDAPVGLADALKLFSVEDHARYVVDTNTGWPDGLTLVRTITVQGTSRADHIVFTRVK